MKAGRYLVWVAIAALGAYALALIASPRGEHWPNTVWFIIAAVCIYSLGYTVLLQVHRPPRSGTRWFTADTGYAAQ